MSGTSEHGTTTSAPARGAAIGRKIAWLEHPLAGRLLAVAGAALFAVAAWLPWQEIILNFRAVGQPDRVEWHSPAQVAGLLIGSLGGGGPRVFEWSVVSVLGVLLAPLLWQRIGATVSHVALGAFALWTLGASALWVILAISITQHQIPFGIACRTGTAARCTGTIVPALFTPGSVLSLIGLLLCWAGMVVLVRAELRGRGATVPPAARYAAEQPRWRGAGWLTSGIILWAVGFLVIPWASYNCAGTPLFVGTCLGVSGSAATQSGIQATTTHFDPLFARYAAVLLIGGGGVLLLFGLWLRVAAGELRVWGWLWVLAALAIGIVADNGVGAIIANPANFALPTGTWRGALGLPLTFAALLVAVVGLVLLEGSARRQKAPAP